MNKCTTEINNLKKFTPLLATNLPEESREIKSQEKLKIYFSHF